LNLCRETPLDSKSNALTFWSLELGGIGDPVDREGDEEAVERFCETIKFMDGRYQVTFS